LPYSKNRAGLTVYLPINQNFPTELSLATAVTGSAPGALAGLPRNPIHRSKLQSLSSKCCKSQQKYHPAGIASVFC